MKKILGLAVAALLVMGLVGGGTWAYFSDTESSTGNVLTAGTLDLTTGGTSLPFSISDVVPDTAETLAANVSLTNGIGNITGDLSIVISNLLNPENTASAVELANGDTADNGNTDGELGSKVEIAIYLDPSDDGFASAEDYYLPADGSAAVAWSSGTTVPEAAWDPINTFGATGDWSAVDTGVSLAATDVTQFKILYRWVDSADATDNIAQSDSASFDLTFTLMQQ